jgi:hypothetical protein
MRALVFLLLLAATLHADPLAGGLEGFPQQASADSWWLYSYDDNLVAPPVWAGPDETDNPYAWSFFFGGRAVWFFADADTAGGAFVGDYTAQKIKGVDVSVSIDPAEIDFIDLAIYADGPQGEDYYFSKIHLPEDLGTEPTWYPLQFRFDEPWFAFNGSEFVPFQPDAGLWSSIQEIGLRVFPVAGTSTESFVGIDDFILVPDVAAPALSVSQSGGNFVMAFTPNPGVSATVQTLSPANTWQAVPGWSERTGPQVFSTPLVPPRKFFRVVTEERLTPVPVP